MDSRDVAYYSQFTALKTSTLQTWIAIGGWDFNDPGPTATTFSDIASSAINRAAFISSLMSFMAEHGFQGADIDWEYPGAPDRSGRPEDTQNLVLLMQEMRAAFGTTYGISMTLPASYWYLRWFDPIAMEPYVDFFGVMTYDLHGPWDASVNDIGSVIIGQTNIPEISNWTLPLWYNGLNPAKLTMGLAYYARGYTVSSVDCMEVGCEWQSASNPGPCTAFGGVLSLQEIESILIPQLGIEPVLDPTAMMKYLVWGNQWIGYDDMETIAMKRAWASSHCFGGTMIWSVDLYSGSGSGDTPDGSVECSTDPGGSSGQEGASSGGCGGLVYIDPSVWTEEEPEISCLPPCTFILPPLQLSTTTTITFPPYVTSLDVAWPVTTGGSTGWTHIVQTTTLTIPPVTTTVISFWDYTLTGSNTASTASTTFYPTRSILPPPFTITNHPNPLEEPTVTHPPVTRTITPPPYPYSFTRDPEDPVVDPIVTIRPGPPGPICRSRCGSPCLLFCEYPCLLNCPDGGNDFIDPSAPDPPPRPTPPTPTVPLPVGANPTTEPDPDDPEGDDPENGEQEDLDTFCAYELSLAPPVYVDPNSGADATQTISPPAPTPTPAPPPDPEPPSPDPDTESRRCYNSGAETSRYDMIEAVEGFCGEHSGTVLDASVRGAAHTLHWTRYNSNPTGWTGAGCFFSGGLACQVAVHLSVTVTNGCRFTVDGPGARDECGRIFRRAIDECDTSSTEYKQGGTVTSNCAVWNIDPNEEF